MVIDSYWSVGEGEVWKDPPFWKWTVI